MVRCNLSVGTAVLVRNNLRKFQQFSGLCNYSSFIMSCFFEWDCIVAFFYKFHTEVGIVADLIGIAGAATATAALWQLLKNKKEKKRLNQIVSVVLQCAEDERRIKPLMVVRRKDITRAELQGILGTIKLADPKQSRYSLSHINTSTFWEDIERLQASDKKEGDTLVIPCTVEEIEQFDSSVIIIPGNFASVGQNEQETA